MLLALWVGLLPATAVAQFANHELGLEAGVLDLRGTSADFASASVPLELHGGVYLGSGFELIGRAGAQLYTIPGVERPERFAFDAALGARYLFLQEELRPYVALSLSGLWLVNEDSRLGGLGESPFYLGLNPALGLEYLVGENVGVGAQLEYTLMFWINTNVGHAFGGRAFVSVYF